MNAVQLSTKAEASLAKVIQRFEAGDLSPITKVIKIRRAAQDHRPSDKWSLGNQILAFIQADGELDCRGFRQWEEVKRNVVKGSHAVYILAPLTMQVDDVKAENGKRTIVKGFRHLPVFPLQMTEGEELPFIDYTPAQLPPLFDVAARLGVSTSYGVTDPTTGGWFSPTKQHIHLGAEDAAIFFHELAHAAHDKLDKLKGGQDVEQETVAEFTAAVLCDLYDIPHSGNAWRYISSYAKDPLTAIMGAMSIVERVLSLILDNEQLT